MRAFRNVSKAREESLKLLYPVLDNQRNEDIEDWGCLAISVFDHWLTREEFKKYFIQRLLDEQVKIDQKWELFYHFLAYDVSCYQARYRSFRRLIFKEPRSRSLFFRRLVLSWKAPFLLVVIPEYEVILKQDNDDTCWLYFKCRESIKPLLEKIRKLGMYTLD